MEFITLNNEIKKPILGLGVYHGADPPEYRKGILDAFTITLWLLFKRSIHWVEKAGMILVCAMVLSCSNSRVAIADKKILIVYLSRTNNTKAVAEIIQKQVGGDLVALELEKPYPQDYKAIVEQVSKENKTGFLPPLKTKIDSIEKYEIVFIGFPTWDMQLPPPVKSFLKQYDLSGKNVIPFNTHAGYGAGSAFENIKAMCPNSTIAGGISIKGGIERDGILFVMEGEKEKEATSQIRKWLEKILISPTN